MLCARIPLSFYNRHFLTEKLEMFFTHQTARTRSGSPTADGLAYFRGFVLSLIFVVLRMCL